MTFSTFQSHTLNKHFKQTPDDQTAVSIYENVKNQHDLVSNGYDNYVVSSRVYSN